MLFRSRLLAVPAVVAALFGAAGGGLAQLFATGNERPIALVTGITAAVAGLCGAAVSVVMAAPQPSSSAKPILPSEIAGAVTAARVGFPILVACLGTAPALFAARAASRPGNVTTTTEHLLNGALVAVVTIVFTATWVKHRAAAHSWWGAQLEAAEQTRRSPARSGGKKP